MSEAAHDAIAAQSGGVGVMDVLSKSLRAQFTAAPGHVLVGGDFSNVEGRVNAWLAGERWKLDAFAAYDAGEGADLYVLGYAKMFNVGVADVTKRLRQIIAKPAELACGFGGSVGAFLRFISDPTPLVSAVLDTKHGSEDWHRAADQYARLKFHNGLSAEQWVAIKVVVNGWRDANPRIVQSWWDLADCAIEAVENPNTKVGGTTGRDGVYRPLCGGMISYMVTDGFLWCKLPSGKLLAYANARLVEKKDDWLVDAEGNAVPADEMDADEIALRIAAGCVLQEGRARTAVCYDGKNQKTGKWSRQYLYGGSQNNNCVQSTARELLCHAMPKVEGAGYPIVMHCHDELVSEVAAHLADGAETCYEGLMSDKPIWAAGLPLATKAWVSKRYVK